MKQKQFNPLSIFLYVLLVFTFYSTVHAGSGSLEYIINSFVKIKTSDDKVIYIDPTATNMYEDSADVVLITHEHGDHNELNRVKQKNGCVVIRAANAIVSGVYQHFKIGNIEISAVAAYNSYHNKSSSVGYIVRFDTVAIYHAGDTDKITEMGNLADSNITYALLPIDGTYTMSPSEAVQAAEMINAQYNIPIHSNPPSGYSSTKMDQFNIENRIILKQRQVIYLDDPYTSADVDEAVLYNYNLEQNYPNPFNPVTTIKYSLPTGEANNYSPVQLKIYDMLGQEVATLVNEQKPAGNYEVKFDASGLGSGVYLYTLSAGKFQSVKKLILLK